jgi:hypothetical protein
MASRRRIVLNPWGFLLLKMTLSETREKLREGKEKAEDAIGEAA